MASSTSITKLITNGDVHLPDQQPEDAFATLVNVVNHLSSDKSYQKLSILVDSNKRLKVENKELADKLKDRDVAERVTFDRIEEVQRESRKAQKECHDKDEELQKAKAREAEAREMLKEREKEVKGLKEKLDKTGKEISKVMKTSKEKNDEVMKLRDTVKKEQQALEQCQKEAKAAQVELTAVKKQHAETTQELSSLKELAFPLRKIDSSALCAIKAHFDSMFEEAYQLADEFFGKVDLSADILRDISWQNLTRDSRLVGIPLHPTNSQATRQMLVAAVIRLIAWAAVEHLLQPVYVTEMGGEMGELLDEVYALDSCRAQRVRSVLMKIDAKTQEANGQARAEAASREVLRSVGPLLVSPDGSRNKQKDFSCAVKGWCDKTRGFWMELQRLEVKFTVLFEGTGSLIPEDWRRLPELQTLPTSPPPQASPSTQGGAPADGAKPKAGPEDGLVAEDIVAQVWPAFFLRKAKDGELNLFKRGYVLVKTQVDTAKREVATNRFLSDSSHRRGRDVQRRRGTLTSGSNNSTENLGSFLN